MSWRSIVAFLPFLGGIALAGWLRSPIGVAWLIAGLVAMLLMHEYLVPLVGRER